VPKVTGHTLGRMAPEQGWTNGDCLATTTA
jgi:hypothetical protein